MTDLSASFFGFRSNLLGTHFTIYDHGESPKKGHAMPDQANLRREVAAVCYVRQSAAICHILNKIQTISVIIIHTELVVAKIKSCIPRAL